MDKSYFYGFVYFRQVKDRNVRRGYFQKSLVILTWFPFISFYQRIMKILAPKYFDFGLPSLEAGILFIFLFCEKFSIFFQFPHF